MSATLTLIERMEREAHAPSDDASNGNQNRQLNHKRFRAKVRKTSPPKTVGHNGERLTTCFQFECVGQDVHC